MELTVKEAIREGYTHYGIDGRDWQTVEDLGDIEDNDFEEWDLILFEKKSNCTSISNNELSDLLSDYIGEQDSENSGRDDDQVYDEIKNIDYTEIVNTINKSLEKYKYWSSTNIKLIK